MYNYNNFNKNSLYHEINYYYKKVKKNLYSKNGFDSLIKVFNSKSEYKINEKILISDELELNKSKISDIKKIYGKPFYKTKNPDSNKLLQYSYKLKIRDTKITVDFYFYNKTVHFYLINFNFYEDKKREKIFNIIYDKYNDGKPIDLYSNYLLDSDENMIMLIDNDVHFSFLYSGKLNTDITNKIINKLISKNRLSINRSISSEKRRLTRLL